MNKKKHQQHISFNSCSHMYLGECIICWEIWESHWHSSTTEGRALFKWDVGVISSAVWDRKRGAHQIHSNGIKQFYCLQFFIFSMNLILFNLRSLIYLWSFIYPKGWRGVFGTEGWRFCPNWVGRIMRGKNTLILFNNQLKCCIFSLIFKGKMVLVINYTCLKIMLEGVWGFSNLILKKSGI